MKKAVLALVALLSSTPGFAQTFRTEEVVFMSHSTKLAGSIVFPAGRIHAAVVFIHGSGRQERNLQLAERFARDGIAALVYDKRGAGRSGGDYEANQSVSEKNIMLLADDAASALRALSTHRAMKGIPVGLAGISQAGWIAPLAAQRSGGLAKFLVMWSGPVCKVSEEDIYSKHTGDANIGPAPPYAEALNARTQKYIWPDFLGRDTDSGEDLAKLWIPGFWIFSDNDPSVPVDLSVDRLRELRKKGHNYEVVVYPGLGHNNMDGTFAAGTDWILRIVGSH